MRTGTVRTQFRWGRGRHDIRGVVSPGEVKGRAVRKSFLLWRTADPLTSGPGLPSIKSCPQGTECSHRKASSPAWGVAVGNGVGGVTRRRKASRLTVGISRIAVTRTARSVIALPARKSRWAVRTARRQRDATGGRRIRRGVVRRDERNLLLTLGVRRRGSGRQRTHLNVKVVHLLAHRFSAGRSHNQTQPHTHQERSGTAGMIAHTWRCSASPSGADERTIQAATMRVHLDRFGRFCHRICRDLSDFLDESLFR